MSEFTQHEKQSGGKCPYPAVSVNHSKGRITFLVNAYQAMGEPTFVNVYSDGHGRLAFEPTTAKERDTAWACQRQAFNGNKMAQISFTAVCDMTDETGTIRYEVEQDEDTGYWVIDLHD